MMMKNLKSILVLLILIFTAYAGKAEMNQPNELKEAKTVVYYFHNTRRCPTCMAIEKTAKAVLAEPAFAGEKGKGELIFESYNAEEVANKKLVEKMGVTGSSLIVVKDGKKTDLTSKAFMYALKQPEKLKKALRSAIGN